MPYDTPHPQPQSTAPEGGLRLVEGTELLGRWDSTAYESTPYMIRRVDGQLIQVSRLLFDLAASLDGGTDLEALAARTSARTGRELSADNVAHLLATKLLPTGVLVTPRTAATAEQGPLGRANPLLALRLRRAVIPERIHRRVTTSLAALFWTPLVVAALVALAGADTWIGVTHGTGVSAGVDGIIAHPALLLILAAMTVVAAVIHETGHAAATRAGGATPGVMGAGIYLAWPVFYTDISDSYRLGRGGRLRADLGGVYFNVLTLLAATAAYAVTHWPLLLVFIVVIHLEVLTQFLPFVRLDGYWVVSDLVGVPNLFAYLGPVLAHLLRRPSPADTARLAQLRPRARRVITGWVVATAAVLAANLVVVAWIGPTLISTTATAAVDRARLIGADVTHSDPVTALADAVSLILLVVPAAGIAYIGAQLLLRAVRAIRRWWRTRPLAATALAAGLAGLAALQALMFVPAEAPTAVGALRAAPGLSVTGTVAGLTAPARSAPARFGPVPVPRPTTPDPIRGAGPARLTSRPIAARPAPAASAAPVPGATSIPSAEGPTAVLASSPVVPAVRPRPVAAPIPSPAVAAAPTLPAPVGAEARGHPSTTVRTTSPITSASSGPPVMSSTPAPVATTAIATAVASTATAAGTVRGAPVRAVSRAVGTASTAVLTVSTAVSRVPAVAAVSSAVRAVRSVPVRAVAPAATTVSRMVGTVSTAVSTVSTAAPAVSRAPLAAGSRAVSKVSTGTAAPGAVLASARALVSARALAPGRSLPIVAEHHDRAGGDRDGGLGAE